MMRAVCAEVQLVGQGRWGEHFRDVSVGTESLLHRSLRS